MDVLKLGIEAALLVGGFVTLVLVMRSKLGDLIELARALAQRMDRLESEIKPLAAQLASLNKDSEVSRRDLQRLEGEVSELRKATSRLERAVTRLQAMQEGRADTLDPEK